MKSYLANIRFLKSLSLTCTHERMYVDAMETARWACKGIETIQMFHFTHRLDTRWLDSLSWTCSTWQLHTMYNNFFNLILAFEMWMHQTTQSCISLEVKLFDFKGGHLIECLQAWWSNSDSVKAENHSTIFRVKWMFVTKRFLKYSWTGVQCNNNECSDLKALFIWFYANKLWKCDIKMQWCVTYNPGESDSFQIRGHIGSHGPDQYNHRITTCK